jgi:hypothetical protein
MVSFSFSGGFLQIVMLIILPFIGSLSSFLLPEVFIVIFIAEIVYGLYPIRTTPEKYLAKRGYENTVMEFEFIKTLLLIAVPIIGITALVNIALSVYYKDLPVYYQDIDLGIYVFAILITIGGFLRIVSQIQKKEFRFYFAKACFIILSKQEDDYEKIRYFLLGLNSYNKYLRRRLKFEVKDITKVYLKFLYADTAEKNKIINSLCESVESNDRLRLTRYLSTLSKIPETELFVGESQLQKFKTIGAFLAVVIPIIISIIGLLKGKP